MRRITAAALVLFMLPLVAPAQDLFIRGGTLLDPALGRSVTENLLILDGRIAGRPAAPPAGFVGEILDASGKWVIPGLHDLHVHSFGNMGPAGTVDMIGTPRTTRLMLFVGVTGFLDLFAPEDLIFALRDQQRKSPGASGADIFAAGPCMTATGGHCSEYGVPTRLIDSPDDARTQIGELGPKMPDVIKIVFDRDHSGMPTIDLETLRAAVAAAHRLGFQTVIHIGTDTWDDALAAVLAGADAVTHTPEGSVVPDDVIAAMLEHGTTIIPTLAVHTDIAWWFGDRSRLDNPLLSAVTSEEIRASYLREPQGGFAAWVESAVSRRATRDFSIRRLSRAGIRIVTGTDSGNPGTFLGYSVHRELLLLVEAGLSPWQALAASTTNAGAFLGRGWGLEDGDEGSLVVLDASPLEDIRNTEQIRDVVHHGSVVDRQALLE